MSIKQLTQHQIDCGKVMLSLIANGEYTIEYGQLSKLTGQSTRLIGSDIGELSKHCYRLGLPLISVMVVNKETHYCGSGFFDLCNELNVHPEYKSKMAKMFDICMKEVKECSEWYKLADYMGIQVNGLRPFEDPIIKSAQKERIEGSLVQVNATVYERDPKLREECLRIHGTSCKICGFNAAKIYGNEFAGRIHAHHINPLGEVKEKHMVNPKTDLIPVCPNCHMILHSKNDGVYSPEEVKNMLNKDKQ